MKKLLLSLAMIALSGLPALAADPLLGLWKTQVDDGAYAYVDVHPCGAKICGTIVRTFNAQGEYKSENLGKDIIRGMVPQGDGYYKGNVWRPSNDKIYIGKIILKGNSMKMKGCVAGGLFCASQTWTRIE